MKAQTLDEYLSELRKQSPKKCQRCECLFADYRKGPQGEGWYYVCETAPDCYQEPAIKESQKSTEVKS